MSNPTVDSYRTIYPNLLLEALKFFSVGNMNKSPGSVSPRTVFEFAHDFHEKFKSSSEFPQPGIIDSLCQSLCRAGFLSPAGVDAKRVNIQGMANCYMGNYRSTESQDRLVERVLNCAVYGFLCIYKEYCGSILPIIHKSKMGQPSIGTGFVVSSHYLLTAAHCIEGATELSIRNISTEHLQRATFHRTKNEALDVGLIRFSSPIFETFSIIVLDNPVLLQDVLALGYPNVAGFLPTLAAEKALISSRLTATKGAIASKSFEIFAKSELLLITARVRGGFSGGPILNDRGNCVGLISREPSHQKEDAYDDLINRYDDLGYGTAIPANVIKKFLMDLNEGVELDSTKLDMKYTNFKNFEE